LKGKHSLKFGFEYGHLEGDSNVPDTGRGKFTFNGGKAFSGSTPMEDLMAGALTNGIALVGNATRVMHWGETAVYAQDDWRLTPKVTLNLGLRYAYESPIKEVNNWISRDPQALRPCGNPIIRISPHAWALPGISQVREPPSCAAAIASCTRRLPRSCG
jgi:hypothetical protein